MVDLRHWQPERQLGFRELTVSVATLFFWLASHTLRPLLPLQLDGLGVSEATIGLILAAHPVGSFLLALPGGRLVDRIGARLAARGGFLLMATCGLGFAFATRPWHFAGLLLVTGVAELMIWIGLQAMASGPKTDERSPRRLAIFSLAWGIGVAAGPLLGAVLLGSVAFWALGVAYATGALVGGLTLIALLPVDWGRPVTTSVQEGSPLGMRSRLSAIGRLRAIQATLVSSFINLFVNAIKMSYYPIALERAGFDLSFIGISIAVVSVASLVVRGPLPWLIRRYGRRRLLLASMWLPILGMAPIPILNSPPQVLLAAVICGVGLGVNPPVTVELMARYAPDGDRGLAMGARLLANRSAQLVQPVAFAALLAVTGMSATFLVAGAMLATATVYAGRRTPELDG